MEQYLKVLMSYGKVCPPLKRDLEQHVHYLLLKKGDLLQDRGNLCDRIFFLEKGIVRGFNFEGRKQHTFWFKKENEFVLQLKSILGEADRDTPAIEALEDCHVWIFPASLVARLNEQYPEFIFLQMILIMEDIVSTRERSRYEELRLSSGKYDYLRQYYPDLIRRVPTKYLASFIGITEREFRHLQESRIKLHLSFRRHRRYKDS